MACQSHFCVGENKFLLPDSGVEALNPEIKGSKLYNMQVSWPIGRLWLMQPNFCVPGRAVGKQQVCECREMGMVTTVGNGLSHCEYEGTIANSNTYWGAIILHK